MARFLVRGQSIDGTVYFDRHGWGHDVREAKRFSRREAEDCISQVRERNARVDLDDKIGHLTLIPSPPKKPKGEGWRRREEREYERLYGDPMGDWMGRNE